MKVRYDREEDILMIKVSDEPIDYAQEIGPIIVHFTKEGKAVLFEIMDATEFLANVAPNQLIELERARLTFLAKPELTTITL
ncbi:MAG: DUF2283 domain-containing protein [Dehalococcoidia bacterium]|nr:DUF2283 domain-containing protein [Dehalococcoidia bacterium]